MYNPLSKVAEEFIDHQEILDTLEYAEANKNNEKLITELIEKAKLRKGLSHREASVLLACEIEEKNQEIYALAEQIKKDMYQNFWCFYTLKNVLLLISRIYTFV